MAWILPFLIAHRGASQLAPENTLAALRLAIERNASAVECDVQLTKDHVPVIFHDDALERTSNGRGVLTAQTFTEIASLDAGGWFDIAFTGEQIPSLKAWLSCAAAANLVLNIELKVSTAQAAEALLKYALPLLRTYPAEKLFLSSLNVDCLMLLKKANVPWSSGFIVEKRISAEEVSLLHHNNIVSVHQPYNLFDQPYLDWLHGQGLRALAYTVNEDSVLQSLTAMGIDGVFSDRV